LMSNESGRKGFLGFSRIVWAWALYDLANTVFSALFVSMNYPLMITQFAGGTEQLVGAIQSVAAIAAAISVPFLGSISDQTGRRLPMLSIMTVLCCIMTPLASFVPLAFMALFSGFAHYSYNAGMALYDAILSDIASPEEQGRVSGFGTAIGYGGTIIALAAAAPIYRILRTEEDLMTSASIRAVNVMVGSLFLLFSIPLFTMHKEKGTGRKIDFTKALHDSVGRVIAGARLASKELWIYIASSFFYTNAAMAVITFFILYANKVLEIPMGKFLIVYAALAVAAGIGSMIAGYATDRFSPRKVLFACGFLWIAIIAFLMKVTTFEAFLVGGALGGAALGTLWTASRPQLIRLADVERMGETFGFLAVAQRSSSVVGPFVFGYLVTRYDSYDLALLSLIGFYAVGIVLLFFVPERLPAAAKQLA
jgi:UMF1 family MFS transporter